ncbi:MAG: transposase [Deltaproteobacteria bacterium]|nr:transposase [Deltaproteobacteria bacterium]
MERRPSQDFIHFLDRLVDELPKDKEIHLIMDNYVTHKTAFINEWLKKHP